MDYFNGVLESKFHTMIVQLYTENVIYLVPCKFNV